VFVATVDDHIIRRVFLFCTVDCSCQLSSRRLAGAVFAGCPCGRDPMKMGRSLAEKGVTIYVVGCEPSITAYRDWFTALAHLTGGQYVPLASAQTLPQVRHTTFVVVS